MNTHEHQSSDRVFVPHCGWVSMPRADDVTNRVREGWFESNEQAFWRMYLRAGDTVIDAGAHAGLYSTIASGLVGPDGSVIAIEPNTELAAMIRINASAHSGSSDARIEIEDAAIWEHDTELTLTHSNRGAAYASVSGSEHKSPDTSQIKVNARTLDSISSKRSLGTIAMLKLDIEGAELEALRGADTLIGSQSIRAVMIEITRDVLDRNSRDAAEVLSPLTSAGYTPCRFDPGSLQLVRADLTDLGEHENLIVCIDMDDANERLRSSDPDQRAAALDVIARGNATRALADASVERDHLEAVVDRLRDDLALAHAQLAQQRERTDTMLRAQEDDITRTIGQLNDTLNETQKRWSESSEHYDVAISGLRSELKETHVHFDQTQKQWDEARAAYEEIIASLRSQLTQTHESWAKTREAYESSIGVLEAMIKERAEDSEGDTIQDTADISSLEESPLDESSLDVSPETANEHPERQDPS